MRAIFSKVRELWRYDPVIATSFFIGTASKPSLKHNHNFSLGPIVLIVGRPILGKMGYQFVVPLPETYPRTNLFSMNKINALMYIKLLISKLRRQCPKMFKRNDAINFIFT